MKLKDFGIDFIWLGLLIAMICSILATVVDKLFLRTILIIVGYISGRLLINKEFAKQNLDGKKEVNKK